MTEVTQSSISLVADTSASSEYRLLELPPEIAAILEDPSSAKAKDGKGVDVDAIKISGKRKREDENDYAWNESQRM